MSESRRTLRPLLVLTLIGVCLRALALPFVQDAELSGDEGFYLHLAVSWKYFGFYPDSLRYLWPPGYPFLLKTSLDLFGAGGLLAMQVLQVAASASTGLSTMLLARRAFGERAACLAGWFWVGYVPLIVYTHCFWTEALFLSLFTPALLLALATMQGDGSRARTILGGLCMAGALYLKESPVFLVPLLAVCFGLGAPSRREAWQRSFLFALVVASALAPWQRHVHRVHDRFLPVAASLGENTFLGWNATYQNYDLAPIHGARKDLGLDHLSRIWRRAFVRKPAPDWPRAEEIQNLPDRQAEQVRRGLDFVSREPTWFLRSRLRKFADLVTPLSTLPRDQATGTAPSTLQRGPMARVLGFGTLLLPPLLLLSALVGFCLGRMDSDARRLVLFWMAYFVATAMLVSMSRFRVPMLPALLVLAGGAWSGSFGEGRAPRLALGAGVLFLGFCWWIPWPELSAVLDMMWEATR